MGFSAAMEEVTEDGSVRGVLAGVETEVEREGVREGKRETGIEEETEDGSGVLDRDTLEPASSLTVPLLLDSIAGLVKVGLVVV